MMQIIRNFQEKLDGIPLDLKRIAFISQASIWGGACLLVAYCLWAMNRGFEISDESYYLLLAMYPDSVNLYVSAQQWIMAPLWDLTGSLASYRLSGFLILIFSSVFLAHGTLQLWLKQNPGLVVSKEKAWLIHVCSMMGALLYGSTINFSPCYNLLAAAGAYVAAGSVFLAMARPDHFIRFTLLMALCGMAIAVELVCKASAGVCTFLLSVIITGIFTGRLWRMAYGLAVVLGACVACVAALVFLYGPFAEILDGFEQGVTLFKMVQTEGTVQRLWRYGVEYAGHLVNIGAAFFIPVVFFLLYAWKRKTLSLLIAFISLLLILLCGGYFLGGADGRYADQIRALLLLVSVTALFSWTVIFKSWKVAFLLSALFLLPYTVAIGTGNQIFTQVIVSLASWGVGIGLMAFASDLDPLTQKICRALCALFVVLIAVQVISSGLRAPYHLPGSLFDHAEPVTIGQIGRVKVDPATRDFLAQMNIAKENCKIPDGAAFIGLYDIPGIALVFSAVTPVSPWINNPAQADTILDFGARAWVGQEMVALRSMADIDPALPERLSPGFAENYRYCGEGIYPTAAQKIKIYAPAL